MISILFMDGNNNDIVLNTLTHQYIVLSIRLGYPSLEQPNYPNFFYSNTGVLLYVAENSRRFQVNTVIPLSLNGPTSVGLASHNFNYLNWKITYDSASIRLFVSWVEKASNLIVPPLDGSSGSIIFSTGLTLIYYQSYANEYGIYYYKIHNDYLSLIRQEVISDPNLKIGNVFGKCHCNRILFLSGK